MANLKSTVGKTVLVAAVAISTVTGLSGCFPVVAAGAASGVLATLDRRSFGAQTEDQAIELKAGSTSL